MLRTTCFNAVAGLEQRLRDYNRLYNHHIPQRMRHHRTPVQPLKAWHQNRPELFRKLGYDHPSPGI